MEKIRLTRIIRTRGQLTIPRRIRKLAPWVEPLSPVSISLEGERTIRIEPSTGDKEIDWEALWGRIGRVRRLRGKRGNLAAFIAADRARRL